MKYKNRTPKMHYVKGEMMPFDICINFVVVKAPIEKVLPLIGGWYRATHDGALLSRGGTNTPEERFAADTHMDKALGLPICTGFLVSRPIDQPGLTVIECPIYDSMDGSGFNRLSPDLEAGHFSSQIQAKNNQSHWFTICRNGEFVRRVHLARGPLYSRNWKFSEQGTPEKWEQTDRYLADAKEDRLNRAMVMNYARNYGLNVEAAIYQRQLENTVYLESGSIYSEQDYRPRTTEFQTEYELARSLGIGEPETDAVAHRAFLQRIDDHHRWENAMKKALGSKRVKTLEKLVELVETHRAALAEFEPEANQKDLYLAAYSKAREIDETDQITQGYAHALKLWTLAYEIIAIQGQNLCENTPEDMSDKLPNTYDMEAMMYRVVTDVGAISDVDAAITAKIKSLASKEIADFCEAKGLETGSL